MTRSLLRGDVYVAQSKSIAAVVMAGLVPAIHVFLFPSKEDVDARPKAGHDGGEGVGLAPV